jgi:hypothetical protein
VHLLAWRTKHWQPVKQPRQPNARIKQINESMGLFGEATNKVNNRLIEYANATARATGVDQNQIKLAQAKLLTFKELATSATRQAARLIERQRQRSTWARQGLVQQK